MDVYVFSDESGIFDYKSHEYFVYAGIIIIGKQEMDSLSRRYSAMEKNLRKKSKYKNMPELKAAFLDEKDRKKLLNVFSDSFKFCVVIRQRKLDTARIFKDAKSKQRYLDFAYKLALRRALEEMVARGSLLPEDSFRLIINEDNHHIATNSLYSKEESIHTELKEGIYRSRFGQFYPPVFRNLESVDISLKDSTTNSLIRGADIVANSVYVSLIKNGALPPDEDLIHIEILP